MGTKQSVPVTATAAGGAPADRATQPSSSTNMGPTLGQSTRAEAPVHGKFGSSPASIRPQQPEPAPMSALDVKITNALRELKRQREQNSEHKECNPFTRILLKAPHLAQAFNSVRSTFEEIDTEKNGYIGCKDMERALERLGVNFSKDEMDQAFHESDMLENGQLTFKEFLVCLAIGFVLHKIPSLEGERLSIFYTPMHDGESTSSTIPFGEGNKLRIAFQLAIDAFLWFDVDGDGQINKEEMAMRLGSSTSLHSPTKKMSIMKEKAATSGKADSGSVNSIISDRRFNEMDWNHDGTIQFKEFLLAFESWVGVDDEENLDES